jgi:hypothetical protein
MDIKITSTQITASPRKLKVKWSLEKETDVRAYHNILFMFDPRESHSKSDWCYFLCSIGILRTFACSWNSKSCEETCPETLRPVDVLRRISKDKNKKKFAFVVLKGLENN